MLALIWSNVIYVTDVKQLHEEFCSNIVSINDAILVRFVYLTTLNWISVVVCFEIFYNKLVKNIFSGLTRITLSLKVEFPQTKLSSTTLAKQVFHKFNTSLSCWSRNYWNNFPYCFNINLATYFTIVFKQVWSITLETELTFENEFLWTAF